MPKEIRILIVDGEPRICQFLEVLLTRSGYRADSAHHADEALARIAADEYNLALADLATPGAGGYAMAARLKAVRPDLQVIMVTGCASLETAVEALLSGADDYVAKPFNVDELRKVVSRALQPVPAAR